MSSPTKPGIPPNKPDSDGGIVGKETSSSPALKSPGSSSERMSKSPSSSEAVVAAERRSRFARGGSGLSFPSNPRMSSDGGATARRRRSSYRRRSSFDLPHINSITTAPDLKRLETLDRSKVPWWTSQRFILSVICFFGFLFLYAQRVNLSIAIVSMVVHDHGPKDSAINGAGAGGLNVTLVNGTSLYNISSTTTPISTTVKVEEEKCPELSKNATGEGEFHWDKPLQGLILGAFFWGYLILQVVGGMVAERFGAKKVIIMGMLPVSILTIVSPFCARADPYFFLVVRVLIGIGEGVMYPAAQALWFRWAPPNERSRLIGFSYAGGQFGNAMIFPVGGFLCAYGFDGGWPTVFYFIGTCGFIWCIVWVVFATDSPDENKRISDIEKKYIEYSLGNRVRRTKVSSEFGVTIPWRAIFTSRGMWGIIIAHMCGNYGAYMLLTQIPSYMKEVLKFDIKSNGVFSMLPYLAFWLFITVSGMLADFLISREILSVGWTRKLMAVIGMIGPGSFLIGTGFMDCNQQMEAVVMLTISVGLCGFHFSGYFINHGDIAPAYAGTLFGITNTAATVPGILAPYVVAALTTNRTREEWQHAFYVAAAVYFFGAAFYVLLGQGDVQPWADQEEPEENKDEEDVNFGVGLHDLHEVHEEEEEDEEEAKAAEEILNSAAKAAPTAAKA
ncbi:sialin-like [Babylonia areolata]|uniref:sialin-like n=1 Tax=Babylonia areolata TaxID=304850 RepID=UPI003FD16821